MTDGTELEINKPLPPPWDRLFSLGSRAFVWALLAGILYLLRPFFLLIFLTFVFAYILEHGVQGLAHRLESRTLRVILVSTVFLGTLITVGVVVTPHFNEQAAELSSNYKEYLASFDTEIKDKLKDMLPAGAIPEKSTAELFNDYFFGGHSGGEGVETNGRQEEIDAKALAFMGEISGTILGISSSFLLSLLFSFLIVLDLPKLSRAARGLANTKLGFIYDEAASTIHSFGVVLGKALEAQLFVAICNTILTSLGLYFLGLTSKMVFLASVVFLCSFIPVAGVVLSSIPIALEALAHEGVQLMLLAIILILAIHMIEAYVLNPQIFGHHLRMNAVMVLIILTIGGKLIGVWGLVLGLPVMNYIFGYAIRHKKTFEEVRTEPGQKTPS